MNILTFDIEEWYNCDFISENFDWSNYEVRIYEATDRILNFLSEKNIKGTFFCLGWLAEHHPAIIKRIHDEGHQVGCHSYQHQLSTRFTPKSFRADTEKAKSLIEDAIGAKVECFRAPGFSITKNNIWAFEVLGELGIKYDCSIFPAHHDYGGMPDYGTPEPSIISVNGVKIKEFPINIKRIAGKSIVFSGGGFFRLFPYYLIKKWANNSEYMMSYFHPRDFDPEQPVVDGLPLIRRFKSYVGLRCSFRKFQHFLSDFDFVNVEQADSMIDWDQVKVIKL